MYQDMTLLLYAGSTLGQLGFAFFPPAVHEAQDIQCGPLMGGANMRIKRVAPVNGNNDYLRSPVVFGFDPYPLYARLFVAKRSWL